MVHLGALPAGVSRQGRHTLAEYNTALAAFSGADFSCFSSERSEQKENFVKRKSKCCAALIPAAAK